MPEQDAFHEPVLREDVLRFLVTNGEYVYVDGTVGGGGHAEGICKRLRGAGRLICFDADEDALVYSRNRLQAFQQRVTFVHSNFRNLKAELHAVNVERIHGILLDLGVSSFQLDEGPRGFSFRADERIDMRMDRRQKMSGWTVVNRYDEKMLAEVLWKYGEERHSRRIARKIVKARPIDSTGRLSSVVESAVGKKFLIKSLARVFQAIRIEVNDELGNLEHVLADSIDLLEPGGRIVVITYHSLEDRITKNRFKEASAQRIPSGSKYIPDAVAVPRLRVLTKTPVKAAAEEIEHNPSARSAKMRVAERL
ncbi:MAG: 16S rRNA (cytosine(1402)-N(4))-methyltransferase RsmH [Ignavibacteriae bacterium]|nr:16S rRNA (cytosine(1402)-N(4))-methyltransferase RsmH [Ignavibacteriota bacterium]